MFIGCGHYINLQFDDLQFTIENSECCRIPKTNREFWVAKIRRNKERDKEEQRKLAEMGWHCITVWECELKPKQKELTLDSLAYTLNHIYLQDRQTRLRLKASPIVRNVLKAMIMFAQRYTSSMKWMPTM